MYSVVGNVALVIFSLVPVVFLLRAINGFVGRKTLRIGDDGQYSWRVWYGGLRHSSKHPMERGGAWGTHKDGRYKYGSGDFGG